jgi:mannitol-specific phosphotransferase system IIBC component
MQDYKISEIKTFKKALEDKISQGLSVLFNNFKDETGLTVNAMQVKFVDVSTLAQAHFLIGGVSVNIVFDQLSIQNKEDKELYEKTE